MDLQDKIERFNSISDNLDYTHWMTGTVYDEDGMLVFVDTPWAMGFSEGDKKGVAIG
jgi:hypothetical protein